MKVDVEEMAVVVLLLCASYVGLILRAIVAMNDVL